LRFSLSLRHVEELMAERRLMVDRTTVRRRCQRYGPVVYQRLKGKLKCKTTAWHRGSYPEETSPQFRSLSLSCLASSDRTNLIAAPLSISNQVCTTSVR